MSAHSNSAKIDQWLISHSSSHCSRYDGFRRKFSFQHISFPIYSAYLWWV